MSGTVTPLSATPIVCICVLHPPTQSLQPSQVHSGFGSCSKNLLDDERSGDTSTPGASRRTLRSNIVAHYDRLDPVAAQYRFSGHLEIHYITVIVLDDQQTPCPGVSFFYGGNDLIRGWRGKDVTGAGSIKHAVSYEPDM